MSNLIIRPTITTQFAGLQSENLDPKLWEHIDDNVLYPVVPNITDYLVTDSNGSISFTPLKNDATSIKSVSVFSYTKSAPASVDVSLSHEFTNVVGPWFSDHSFGLSDTWSWNVTTLTVGKLDYNGFVVPPIKLNNLNVFCQLNLVGALFDYIAALYVTVELADGTCFRHKHNRR